MIADQSLAPSPQFIQSTQAAIAHWQWRTQEMDDDVIRQLDKERSNILNAVQLGLTLPQTWHSTASLTLQVFDMVQRRGYWQEWIPILEEAVAACTNKQLPLKLNLLSRLGQLQRFTQQLQAAIQTHLKAETLAQQLSDSQALAIAYCDLSEDYLRTRDYIATEKYGYAALMELDTLNTGAYWKACVFNTLGEMARFQGDLVTSMEMLSQSVLIRRQLGQSISLVRALNNLANTLQTAGKFNEALECYKEASELLAVTSYELDRATVQINLGSLYFHLEQWSNAEDALKHVDLAYLSQSNKTYYEAAATQNLGNVLLKQGRSNEAIPYLQRAVILWETVDEEIEQANSMGTLGEALAILGHITEATSFYQKAIAKLQKLPDDPRVRNLMKEFMFDYEQLGDER